MNNWLKIFRFGNYSLRTKLLVSMISTSVLAVVSFGAFALYRNQQSQTAWNNELQNTVQQRSQQEVASLAEFEAHNADDALSEITAAVQQLADYQASLFATSSYLGQGGYWDGNSKLIRLSDGQYGNADSDLGSIFIPSTVTLSPSLITNLNTSMYLDFSAPSVLKENPNVVAVYYMSTEDYTVYYPNINLTSVLPPDFKVTEQAFFTVATPENNPGRKAVWTVPYQDPAGTGLIVTNAVPVYDQNNRFHGVMAADVQLSKISEQISTVRLGETGFAFLIDPSGHIIAMPEVGYELFGVEPEIVPVNESPKTTLVGVGQADFQNIIQQMVKGENGMTSVTIQDAQYYIAYAPLPIIGYSIGLIAPSAELDHDYLSTRLKLQKDAKVNLNLFIIVLLVVVMTAIGSGMFLSQSMTSPLVQLTKVASEVSKGNLDAKAKIQTADEIGVLASTFNDMTSQLQETLQGLEQRVAARTRDLQIVAEVGTATATVLESKRLLQEVVDLTKESFHLYHSHIYLLDEAGKNLILAAGAGEPGRQMLAKGLSIPLDREQSLVARAARERKGITVNDVRQAPDFLPNPLLPDTRSELAVPMMLGGNLMGVFDIQSDQVGRFTDADVNIQTTMAAQLATSIQNVRAFEKAKAQAEMESLVNTIGQRIQRAGSVDDTLQIAIREIGLALGATRVSAGIGLARKNSDDGTSRN